jgi:hypothetical protein
MGPTLFPSLPLPLGLAFLKAWAAPFIESFPDGQRELVGTIKGDDFCIVPLPFLTRKSTAPILRLPKTELLAPFPRLIRVVFEIIVVVVRPGVAIPVTITTETGITDRSKGGSSRHAEA